MARRTQYRIISENSFVFSTFTLYGDRDEGTDAVLLGMIREAWALASLKQDGRRRVLVECEVVEF